MVLSLERLELSHSLVGVGRLLSLHMNNQCYRSDRYTFLVINRTVLRRLGNQKLVKTSKFPSLPCPISCAGLSNLGQKRNLKCLMTGNRTQHPWKITLPWAPTDCSQPPVRSLQSCWSMSITCLLSVLYHRAALIYPESGHDLT